MANQPNIGQLCALPKIKLDEEGRRDKFALVASRRRPLMSSKGMRNERPSTTIFGHLIPIPFQSVKIGLGDLKIKSPPQAMRTAGKF